MTMEEKVIVQEKIVLPKPRKSPILAFLLSFFFPFGVGPFYNGEVVKGFVYLVIFAGLVTMQQHGDAQPFAGILLLGNFEVISYKTILDFWPVVVIVIGGKLIFDYFSKKD